MDSDNLENHKFLPSGPWEGFYCYNDSPAQHKMSIHLKFADNQVFGSGLDDVDSFIWRGKYNLNDLKVNMTKIYPTHNILYNGDIDENGIWGIWNNGEDLSKLGFSPEVITAIKSAFADKLNGGFHIWPVRKIEESEENVEEEELVKSLKLEEIYIEHFT